jgi:hypothetical protein
LLSKPLEVNPPFHHREATAGKAASIPKACNAANSICVGMKNLFQGFAPDRPLADYSVKLGLRDADGPA